jgi:hypothetical protein
MYVCKVGWGDEISEYWIWNGSVMEPLICHQSLVYGLFDIQGSLFAGGETPPESCLYKFQHIL